MSPRVVADGNSLYLTARWASYSSSYLRSTNNGINWEPKGMPFDYFLYYPCSELPASIRKDVILHIAEHLINRLTGLEGMFYNRAFPPDFEFNPLSAIPLVEESPSITFWVRDNVSLAVSSYGRVVAWTQKDVGIGNHVWYRVWKDDPLEWQPAKQIPGTYNDAHSVDVAITSSGIIYAVWEEGPEFGNKEIYLQKSTDYGTTWLPDVVNLSNNPQYDSKQPAISIGSQGDTYAYVVWADNDPQDNPSATYLIRCKRTNGIRFTTLTPNDPDVRFQEYPRSSVDKWDTLHVVWDHSNEKDQIYRIYYDKSSDGGDTWMLSFDYRVSDPDAEFCDRPDITSNFPYNVDGPHAMRHVAYFQGQGMLEMIWYRKNYNEQDPPCPTQSLAGECAGNPHLWWGGPDCDIPDTIGTYVIYRNGVPIDTVPPGPFGITEYWDMGVDCSIQLTCYYVTVMDMAENESSPSNTVCVGGPGPGGGNLVASVNAGTEVPSQYTVKRSGYYKWGNTPDKTVDYDPLKLIYRFSNLDKNAFYGIEVVYYQSHVRSSGRRQSLFVDDVKLHNKIPIPGKPARCWFILPSSIYQDGTIDVILERWRGQDVIVSELNLYRLKDGGPQSSGISTSRFELKLFEAFPNPTAGEVEIGYQLPKKEEVSLSIYNVAGQLVRNLFVGEAQAGYHKILWDGKDFSGKNVKSGVYFYRLKAGNLSQSKRLVILR